MPEESIAARPVTRIKHRAITRADDRLVIEEPLEIRIGDRAFSVTMRTPGQDFNLVRGLLFTEGIIQSADEVGSLQYCRSERDISDSPNIVNVHLVGIEVAERLWQRNLMAGSSCGLCGKTTIDALSAKVAPMVVRFTVASSVLAELPAILRSAQDMFGKTGGLHAAGIFSLNGNPLVICEDIGRHNAADKAIGVGLAAGWLPSEDPLILLVSGRASFEIVQKGLMARIPMIAAVSAASSLAVDLADANNITLAGFLRDGAMTIYTHPETIVID